MELTQVKRISDSAYSARITIDGKESDYTATKNAKIGIGPKVWAAVQQWMDDGNQIVVPEPPTEDQIRAQIPNIDARQMRLALLELEIPEADVLDAIDGIDNADLKARALIEWNHSTTFPRLNPTVISLGIALGFSEGDIDKLFIDASGL